MVKAIRSTAIVLLAISLLTACSAFVNAEGDVPASGDGQIRRVQVSKQDITSVLAVSGHTETKSEISLVAEKSGPIEWKVKEGQTVKAGAVLAEIDGDKITSPSDGKVLSIAVPTGTTAHPNFPIGAFEARTLGIKVQVPVEDAYRLYSTPTKAKANIESGPAAQTCDLFLASELENADSEEQDLPEFVCLLEPEVNTMPGLPAKLGIETASSANTLTLPVESVSGSAQSGQVTIISDDNELQKRDVKLGISDGSMIEIIEGVKEGDSVMAVAPEIFDE